MPDQDREPRVRIRQSGAVNIAAAGDITGVRIELPGVRLTGDQDQADDES